ncbi:MAG: 5'/3'-nucleotidase SurE [Dehalococcoidia bacterium]
MSPLILVTNDDGINSPGLLAAVEAVHSLGEILVIAPEKQQSGAARSHPSCKGRIHERVIEIERERVAAFSLDGSPAQAVQYGILRLRPRKPALAISGINYGENVGANITVSGTIGAAIEVASYGIPPWLSPWRPSPSTTSHTARR